jgi:hypothetical protein
MDDNEPGTAPTARALALHNAAGGIEDLAEFLQTAAAPTIALVEFLQTIATPTNSAGRLPETAPRDTTWENLLSQRTAEWLTQRTTTPTIGLATQRTVVAIRRPPPVRVAFWPDRPGRYFWIGIEEWSFSELTARRKASRAVARLLRNPCLRHFASLRVIVKPPTGHGPWKVAISAYVRIQH